MCITVVELVVVVVVVVLVVVVVEAIGITYRQTSRGIWTLCVPLTLYIRSRCSQVR